MQGMLRPAAALLLALSFLTATSHAARAETSEVRLALVFGLGYLPAYVVRDHKLLEKHARALSLPDVKLTISKVGGGPVANEMLLSGVADLAAGGSTILMTLWDRTRTRDNAVRGVLSLSDMPVYLITTDPRIRSIADYTGEDRIAVSGVKVTLQALVLEMAAARQFGWDQRFRLDPFTVSLPHPDAVIALLSGKHEVKSHVATVPYNLQELADPRARLLLSSFDLAGGSHSAVVLFGSERWKNQNPTVYRAVVAAFEEAIDFINSDHEAAADIYLREEASVLTKAQIVEILRAKKDLIFTSRPRAIKLFADFMQSVGLLKKKPDSWKDLFFENNHDKDGS